MENNKIYGKHIAGIPIFAPYEAGVLVRNPRGEGLPPQVKTKDGTVAYNKWEKKYFANTKGRPKKYHTKEERAEAKRALAKKYYQQKKEQEHKITGE
jgi:hypothetical protein